MSRNRSEGKSCALTGAKVTPSPSMFTNVGREINAKFPGTTGSLGCAISEAVEAAVSQDSYRYVLGSVLSQVLLHQSIIGLETKTALDQVWYPGGYDHRMLPAAVQSGRADFCRLQERF